MMDYADLPIFAFLADFRWSKNVEIATFLGVVRFLASSVVLMVADFLDASVYLCANASEWRRLGTWSVRHEVSVGRFEGNCDDG